MKTSSLNFSFIALMTCLASCTSDTKVDPVIDSEGIYMPLNPIDLIKNFSDHQAELPTAPNMSRFALKYFDDVALRTPKDQTIEQVASKMGISSQDIDSAKQLYLTARQSVADNQDNLSAGLKSGSSDQLQTVTERLDRFFAL